MAQKSRPLVVAAIDFGTTYSGWAFSFMHEFSSDPTKISSKHWHGGDLVSLKGPTTALIRKDDEELDSFGYDAEKKYSGLTDKENWYFFRRFKMLLFDNSTLNRNTILTDACGHTLPAMKVFSLCIKYLKADFLETMKDQTDISYIEDNEMHVVLTVPAIWSDNAKQFMREAAIQAGIRDDNLVIALEPEAASIYCRHLSIRQLEGAGEVSMNTLSEGTKYIVLDAGGGTVDVTVHEILGNGHLKEILAASGGAWGGTKVDDAFVQFLEVIAGKELIGELRTNYPDDFLDLMRSFEVRKRGVKTADTHEIVIRIPVLTFADICSEKGYPSVNETLSKSPYQRCVTLKRDRLSISSEIFKGFFSETLESIARHITDLFENPDVEACFGILMVGGFSEAFLLKDKIKTTFPGKKIIVPQDPGLAVLRGAVIFGHKPESISYRISRFTYGTVVVNAFIDWLHPPSKRIVIEGQPYCDDIFYTLIRTGECLKVGQRKDCGSLFPTTKSQTTVPFKFYAAKNKTPTYVTDDGCMRVGFLSVDTPINSNSERNIKIAIIFGGTEIKVECTQVDTGKINNVVIDFLG